MTLAARSAVILLLAGCLAAATAYLARVSYDLGSLLPAARTPGQQVLKERLGEGPGAQATYVVLPNASAETASAVAERLRRIPLVRRVFPMDDEPGPESLPGVLTRSQFLLVDLPVDQKEWRGVLEDRLADIALADDDLTRLIAADPMLAAVGTLAGLLGDPPRYDYAEGRYLIVSTTAPAFDARAQSRIVQAIRTAIDQSDIADARLYGAGVYTADLQASVRFEAMLFSVLAGGGLICLLLWRFRSWPVLIGIATPMVAGTAVGFVAVALMHAEIHGIALAFGFTLLGVAVDYPLHLFAHPGRSQLVWPTLRISIASTLIAYAVFLFGGSPALAQLGTFAVFGIAAAGLASAWLTRARAPAEPVKAPADHGLSGSTGQPLSNWPWLIGLAVSTPLFILGPSFSDDLASLTPIAPEVLAADAELRQRLGSSDVRHLVAIQSESLEVVLERTEAVATGLDRAVAHDALAGFSHAAQLLPSRRTQQQRRSALGRFVAEGGTGPGTAFAGAADELGFVADAFQPFDSRATAAWQAADVLTRDALRDDDDLRLFVDTHLYAAGDGWKSLVFLRGIADVTATEDALAELPDVEFVDLKSSSTSLAAQFRQRLLGVLGISLMAIAGAVYVLTRSARRAVWVVGTVAAALVVAATGASYLGDGMSPFDLMSLALVAGLGLDYSLFFSKQSHDDQDATRTAHAVLICAVSSLLVFGILACSSIPVLSGIGATVATGVLTAYLFARFGKSERPGLRDAAGMS